MDAPLGQAPERRYREEHGKLVVEWLRQHYEIGDRGHTILKATVFHDYLVMCRNTGIESTTAAVFGRFVKKAFPTVKCSRKGLEGKSLHCYRCLKRIDGSVASTSTASSDEESSPRKITNPPPPRAELHDHLVAIGTSSHRVRGSSGSVEGTSGSDSTDDGYDDELRCTIEELTRAAGDALFDSSTHIHEQQPQPPLAISYNNNLPVDFANPDSTAMLDLFCDGPERSTSNPRHHFGTTQSHLNVNNAMSYYPAQGREYLLPAEPEPAPSHPYQSAPMRPSTSFIPLPPFDPLDNYNYNSNSTLAAYPLATFSTIPSAASSLSYELDSNWPAEESDPSLHLTLHNGQNHTVLSQLAPVGGGAGGSGITSYPTSLATTSHNFVTSPGLSDALSTKTFYWKPGRPASLSESPSSSSSSSTRIKDLGMIIGAEPWTTSNPTPYPIANGQDHRHIDFPGRTLTPPFHPVHTTQSCPVHSQPSSQFGPTFRSGLSSSSSSSTGYRPLHMRDLDY